MLQPSLIRYPPELIPNYVSQLNFPLKCGCSSVTSEKNWTPDKSCCDIAVLIFASIEALLERAGVNGFILHRHNKNNRPMKHPPWGRGWWVWNHFQLCPRFFVFLKLCFVVVCCRDTVGWVIVLWEINLIIGVQHDSFKKCCFVDSLEVRWFVKLCSTDCWCSSSG